MSTETNEFGGGFQRPAESRSGDVRSATSESQDNVGYSAGAPRPPASVVGDDVLPGSTNTTRGVVRRKKRLIKSTSSAIGLSPVVKNYRTSDVVMFNNLNEMFQDIISRDYAQEIVEDLFQRWNIPTDKPDTVKFAEDLLWSFLIATTASNKADYSREYDIPSGDRDITVNFSALSEILASVYGVTRRQFARAVADDQHNYIRHDANKYLLPILATRVGCDPQYAHLAFDGSTHCSGMTSREMTFTRTLESRNLFEDESILATGASERLMDGPRVGVSSKVPR